MTNVFSLKLVVGQYIATPTVMNFFLVLISTFPIHSFVSKSSPYFLIAVVWLAQFHVQARGMKWVTLLTVTSDLSRFPWRVPTEYKWVPIHVLLSEPVWPSGRALGW